jgi:hypothetical protein
MRLLNVRVSYRPEEEPVGFWRTILRSDMGGHNGGFQMNKQQELIQYQIDSLRYKQQDYRGYAEREAKYDRYRAADEYELLAKGIGIAIDVLTENKREAGDD